MKFFVMVSFAVLMGTAARAQSPTDFSAIEAKLKACETANVDPDGSARCQIAAFTTADKRLNQVYGGIVAYLKRPNPDHDIDTAEIVKRLVAAERAWVVFRDAQCTYMSSTALNAPLEGYEYHSCRYQLTKDRIKALTAPDAPSNTR